MAFVLPTKSAVVVVFLAGCVISTWLSFRLRAEVVWPAARVLGVGTAVGAPVGVVVLAVVSAAALRVVLGLTTCVAALWIITSARWATREASPSRSSTVALGLAGGVLNTALSTSGPPLVFALRRAGFHGDRFRATISAVFVVANVIGLPALAVAGLITAVDLELAATSLVPCVIGMVIGARLGALMSTAHFTWAVDVLLLATGALTITRALG